MTDKELFIRYIQTSGMFPGVYPWPTYKSKYGEAVRETTHFKMWIASYWLGEILRPVFEPALDRMERLLQKITRG